MKDPSQLQKLPLYIITKDTSTNPFSLWNFIPQSDDFKSWSDPENVKYADLLEKMLAMTKVSDPIEVVVEIKCSRGKAMFLQLTDTLFLP